jgi:hypothetical protein
MKCPHTKNVVCDYLAKPDNLDSYVCSGCSHYIPQPTEPEPPQPEGKLFVILIAGILVALFFAISMFINYLRS